MAGSSEVERAGSGERELLTLHSMDDPCTKRLRLRRLLAYLRRHGYGEIYLAARRIMPGIFHTKDVAKKVKEGQWLEAASYIDSFAPFRESGYEARLLVQFLLDFMRLDAFARTGHISSPEKHFWKWLKSMYNKPVLYKYPCFATLVEDVVLERDEHARAFFDWQLVRKKAAKVAEEMAYKTPELRGRMDYPRSHQFVHVGSRRCVKKNSGRKQSVALAHYYLQMKKRLPSSSPGANHNESTAGSRMFDAESVQKTMHGEPLIALFETSLEAGRCSIVEDVRPPHLPKEGVRVVTKAAGAFRVTVTHRSSLQPPPQLSVRLAMNPIMQAQQGTSRPDQCRVTLPSSLQRQPELSSGLAMKRPIMHGSRQEAHPGNPSKKP